MKPPLSEHEKALIRATRKGKPGAFEELVEFYQPLVKRHISNLLHQYGCTHLISDHLEEIAQQVWAELFVKHHKYPEEKFLSWFAFLRRWKTLDYIRKELKYQNRHISKEANPGMGLKDDSKQLKGPEEAFRNKQLRIQIRLCLEGIPEKHQEFIRLYYFKGWTYRKIADHLGISLGSVGSIHTRALRKLKKCMEKNKMQKE